MAMIQCNFKFRSLRTVIEYAAVELFDLSFLPFLLIEIYSMAAEVYLRSKYSDW